VQILKCLGDLFDNDLSNWFFYLQLPGMIIVCPQETSEVPSVAMLKYKVIIIICPILPIQFDDSVMLHFRKNQSLIKNIVKMIEYGCRVLINAYWWRRRAAANLFYRIGLLIYDYWIYLREVSLPYLCLEDRWMMSSDDAFCNNTWWNFFLLQRIFNSMLRLLFLDPVPHRMLSHYEAL